MQEALKFKNGNKRNIKDNVILAITNDVPRPPIGIKRPPPIYIFLRLEGWVVNNYMIDIETAIIIIPRVVSKAMKLYITWCVDGVI